MRLSLIIIGIVLILGGAFGYCVTVPGWKVWFFGIPISIPNVWSIFRPLVWVTLALGFICFIGGFLIKKE